MRRGQQMPLVLDSSAVRRMGRKQIGIRGILPPPIPVVINCEDAQTARRVASSLRGYLDVADVSATMEGLNQALAVLSEGILGKLDT